MSELVDKLMSIHDSLTQAGIAHAFGGAVALAYCVEEPRGTRDIDVNIFVEAARAKVTLSHLPDGVRVRPKDLAQVVRDGQARLDWDGTPIDVFLNNVPLHDAVAAAVVWVPLAGREIPVLGCASLAIFKAFFARTKDWADLEAIARTTPEDIDAAAASIAELVGPDDPAVARLESLIP
ncbi:MAG: hypothetical protein ACJ75S_05790, partial [Solirubrobacterales bacterium]